MVAAISHSNEEDVSCRWLLKMTLDIYFSITGRDFISRARRRAASIKIALPHTVAGGECSARQKLFSRRRFMPACSDEQKCNMMKRLAHF